MDEFELRLHCLELAHSMLRPSGNNDPKHVVETASVMYDFVKASIPEETPVPEVDKSKRKKTAQVDILS